MQSLCSRTSCDALVATKGTRSLIPVESAPRLRHHLLPAKRSCLQHVSGPEHQPHRLSEKHSALQAVPSTATAVAATSLDYICVADVMTGGKIWSCSPDDTVDTVLELLVEHRITGLPVIDEAGKVVGVVSDFDLLALDTLGRTNDDMDMFPEAGQTWQAFKELKTLVAKSSGKKVKDVMTKKPICVRPNTYLEDAAKLLLSKKIRRLPVVDEQGKLTGLLSRGNIIKAALTLRQAELKKTGQRS